MNDKFIKNYFLNIFIVTGIIINYEIIKRSKIYKPSLKEIFYVYRIIALKIRLSEIMKLYYISGMNFLHFFCEIPTKISHSVRNF